MSLLELVLKGRRNILAQGGHLEALHLGSRAEFQLVDDIARLHGLPRQFDKFMGMLVEVPPVGSIPTPDYCAISWKRSPRSAAILFEEIQQ